MDLDRVFDLYTKFGNKGYIGEEVTQLEHATQTALLAEEHFKSVATRIHPTEVILGAFLHDIGHLLVYEELPQLETMGDLGVKDHEEIGAYFLKKLGFTYNICEFVRNHINTKRFIISVNNDYYSNLSSASKGTLNYQGGKMDRKELIEFHNNPLFRWHLKIRQWDDMAKSTDHNLLKKIKNMNPVEYYKNMAKDYFNFLREEKLAPL